MKIGDVVDGHWLLGRLISVQGKEGCTDARCTRLYENGKAGRCVGYHCAVCGEPSSMYGHEKCRQSSPTTRQFG